MLVSLMALASTVSIDSLGIGITYAIRKTKISNIAKAILFLISLSITTISVCIGNVINSILPEFFTKLIGIILLVCMGIWITFQSVSKKDDTCLDSNKNKRKTYNIILKSLGITIRIIRNPISSDLDNSKKIDAKEALYLGFALSIDSICVGIGSSIIGLSSYAFPILVSTFQLIFLSIRFIFRGKNYFYFKNTR